VKFIGSNLSLPFPMGQTHLSEEKKNGGERLGKSSSNLSHYK